MRNSLYMLRTRTWRPQEKLSLLWFLLFTTQAYLRVNACDRASTTTVARGLRDGLRPQPAAA